MNTYRIYTEDVNRNEIEKVVNGLYDGYTIYNATGVWKGAKEKSLIIEIATEAKSKILKIAKTIKKMNEQEAVMIQTIQNKNEMI